MKSRKKKPQGRPLSDPGNQQEWVASLKAAEAEYHKQKTETRWGALHVEEKGPIPGKRSFRHWKPRCPAGKLKKGEILILEYYDGTAAPGDGWHMHEWASAIFNHPVDQRLRQDDSHRHKDRNIPRKVRDESEPIQKLLKELRSRRRKISKVLKDRPDESLQMHGIRFKESCDQIILALEGYGDLAMLILGAYEAGFRHGTIESASTQDVIEERRKAKSHHLNSSEGVRKRRRGPRALPRVTQFLLEQFVAYKKQRSQEPTMRELIDYIDGHQFKNGTRVDVDFKEETIDLADIAANPVSFKSVENRLTTVRRRHREEMVSDDQ